MTLPHKNAKKNRYLSPNHPNTRKIQSFAFPSYKFKAICLSVFVQGPNLSELIEKVEKIVENAQNLNLFATPPGTQQSQTGTPEMYCSVFRCVVVVFGVLYNRNGFHWSVVNHGRHVWVLCDVLPVL